MFHTNVDLVNKFQYFRMVIGWCLIPSFILTEHMSLPVQVDLVNLCRKV